MDDEKLTPKENIQAALWGLPFSIGGFWLLGYLESVDKVGWVWWPALLTTIFATALTVMGFCSLVWHWITPIVTPAVETLSKVITYLAITAFYLWLATELFDALGDLRQGEILAFIVGGAVVYLILHRRK